MRLISRSYLVNGGESGEGTKENMYIEHTYLATILFQALGQILRRNMKIKNEMMFSGDFNIQIELVSIHLVPMNSITN